MGTLKNKTMFQTAKDLQKQKLLRMARELPFISPTNITSKGLRLGVNETAPQVKALATHARQPEFAAQDPHGSGRRKPSPQSCPLTSTCAPWHMPTHTHTHARHTSKKKF